MAGQSLEKCAIRTEICEQTSFDWIHKILASLGKFKKEQMLSRICEIDDVFNEYSEKVSSNLKCDTRKKGESVLIK